MKGEGGVCWTRYYLLAASHSKPKVSYSDGIHAQVCMALCEAFDEGGVCWTRHYLPAASHVKSLVAMASVCPGMYGAVGSI